jgi:hypothetical protein
MKKLLLCIAILCCKGISAQLYTAGTHYSNYHDIVPDSLLKYSVTPYSEQSYSLNIFGNAGYELKFQTRGAVSSGGSASYIFITSLNPNIYIRFGRYDSVWVPGESRYNITRVAKPLMNGDVINAQDAVWMRDTLYLTDHSGHGGGNKNVNDFVGGDKFLGVKYVKKDYNNGDSELYGWIWMRCIAEDSCYVKEYSRMGPTTGLVKFGEAVLHMYPNPVSGSFYISGMPFREFSADGLSIYDLLGNRVGFRYNRQGDRTEIIMDQNPAGLYFLTYEYNGASYSGKLVKNR